MIVDTFAGGGGASEGIEAAVGHEVDVAINHDEAAIRMHAANHPKTKHYTEDVWKADPRMVTGGRPVGMLWASPDCKHFSRAKGGKPVKKNIRSLAWVVCKWAAQAKPRVIFLENVREFEGWGPLVPRWSCAACGWKGTEGQATLLRARRRCPSCESLRLREEVVDKKPVLIPCPKRKGMTYRRFIARLKSLGYSSIQAKVLNAADYGAPTNRKRLVLVCRRDGKPVVWPAPTHCDPRKLGPDLLGSGMKPYRTAAECMDWTIPVPSIFDRKKPLAEATLRRTAHGVVRYVLESANPFIVGVGGRMGQTLEAGLGQPHNTITAKNDRAVAVPHFMPLTHHGDRPGSSGFDPLPTITAAHRGEQAVVATNLIRYNGDEGREANAHSMDEPFNVIPTENRFGVMGSTLIQTGYGEREGQAPRTLDLQKPMGVAVDGCKQALVGAFLGKAYGGNWTPGIPADVPLDVITAQDHHQLTAAFLVHLNHGGKQDSSLEEPMRTVMAGGTHAALVYAHVKRYFPDHPNLNHDLKLIIVKWGGCLWVVVDIGLRMLEPRELARGQGFRESYILTGTKTSQVARIGNSVPPPLAQAVVSANYA